jgi:hypothetical protein
MQKSVVKVRSAPTEQPRGQQQPSHLIPPQRQGSAQAWEGMGRKLSSNRAALNNQRSPIRTKTAREQSSPNSEKSPRKLRDLIKRNAGFMAKASKCE